MKNVLRLVKNIFPFWMLRIGYLFFHRYGFRASLSHRKILNEIRKNKRCRTVFMISSLPMMHYEGLRDLLEKDPLFDVKVVLTPLASLSEIEKDRSISQLKDYFDSKGIKYKLGYNSPNTEKWLQNYRPQLMFYTQPYQGSVAKEYDWERFTNSALFCYQSYGLMTLKASWTKNILYLNNAWIIFASTPYELADFKKFSFKRGKNVCVTYDAGADKFKSPRKI